MSSHCASVKKYYDIPEKQNSDFTNVSGKTGMLFAYEFVHTLKILLKRIEPQKYSVLNKKEKFSSLTSIYSLRSSRTDVISLRGKKKRLNIF